MMRESRSIACLTLLLTVINCPIAFGQTPPQETGETSEPMALQESSTTTETTTAETARSSEGFWIFPEPAPIGSIVTDRPGFSDSASLVPRGRFQIESGYTFTYDREHDKRVIDHNFPELAFRTGLTDWLEFRALWIGYGLTETLDQIKTRAGRRVGHEDHDDGCRDTNLGFKIPIFCQKEGCWIPTVSVIPSLYVPTGKESKSFDNVVPEIKFPWNYCVTECFTVYGSILERVPDGEDGQFCQTAATLAGAYKIHECVSLYLEYFGNYPALKDSDCAHLLSGGPIFKITDTISLDTRVSVGLNEQAPDFQTSIGFGIRF
jgi:outer membrane putative beta-barrel porin/alpha-amylase